MSVSYIVKYKDPVGKETKYSGAACYSGNYNYILDLKISKFLVFQNYEKFDTGRGNYGINISKKERDEYIEFLMKNCQFKFKDVVNKEYLDFYKCNYYEIDVSKMSVLGVKILLNALRYLWEYPEIVKSCVMLKNNNKRVSGFNIFLLSHIHRMFLLGRVLENELYCADGHTCAIDINTPLTNPKLRKQILFNKDFDKLTQKTYAYVCLSKDFSSLENFEKTVQMANSTGGRLIFSKKVGSQVNKDSSADELVKWYKKYYKNFNEQ